MSALTCVNPILTDVNVRPARSCHAGPSTLHKEIAE